MAEGMCQIPGLGDARRNGEGPCRLFDFFPLHFERLRQLSAQHIEIGSRRHVDGLRRKTAELIVGKNIYGTGVGLVRRKPIRIAQPKQAQGMAVRDELLIPSSLGTKTFHRGVGTEGNDGIGATQNFFIQRSMGFHQFPQRNRQSPDKAKNFAAGAGVLPVAGKFDHVMRAEQEAMGQAGPRRDGQVSRADMIDKFGRTGANGHTALLVANPGIQRIDVAELRPQQTK